jgi:hypothetical protein
MDLEQHQELLGGTVMRRALVIGIDHYEHFSSLLGCVNDSFAVKSALERHGDGTVNFTVKHIPSTSEATAVSRVVLRQSIQELFSFDGEIALLYFAGHGFVDPTGGFICSSDATTGADGVSLQEIVTMANQSQANNKVIVLDSCHSGVAGSQAMSGLAELSTGLTILTASTAEQYATEAEGHGVFTTLFVDALEGAAANIVGEITPGSVYAHIDQSLGPWDQRPVFKTNVKSFVALKHVPPKLSLSDLQRLTEFFPHAGAEYQLDPSYEPERSGSDSEAKWPLPDPENTLKFSILQKLNRVNLVIPVGAPHMWHAAVESKTCKLTVLGEHYRRLVEKGRI